MISISQRANVIRDLRRSLAQAAVAVVSSGSKHPQIIAEYRHGPEGSRSARSMRNENKIPGVIYGPDWPRSTANGPRIAIMLDEKDIRKEATRRQLALENTLYEVVLSDDTKFKAIIRQYQVCGLTGQPLSVNFLRYKPGTRLRIPVVYINDDSSIDIKRGAFLVHVNRFVNCVCNLEDDIPRVITVDLSDAKTNDVIMLSQVPLPPGVVPLLGKGTDVVLGKIQK